MSSEDSNEESSEDEQEHGGEEVASEKRRRLEEKELRLEEKEEQLDRQEAELEKYSERLDDKEAELDREEVELEEKRGELDELEDDLDRKASRLDEKETWVERLREQSEEDTKREEDRLNEALSKKSQVERGKKSRVAGGILLIFIGLLTVVGAFGVFSAIAGGSLTLNFDPGAMAGLGLLGSAVVGGATSAGPSMTLGITGILLLGAVVLVIAIIEIIGGWQAFQGKHWYYSLITGVIGLILIFPLGLLTLFLIALSEPQFE